MSVSEKQETSPSLEEKLSALNGFLDRHRFVMLVTRAPDGALHARTMAPVDRTKDMRLRFIYDRDSYKENEMENDSHVNLNVDGMNKNDGWLSIAGKAKRITDEGMVAKMYNPSIKAWFGDKGDGVHTGGPEDPRMAVLEVVPDEIRHYHHTVTTLGYVAHVATAAITGNEATGVGEIRTITKEELATVK